MSTTRNSKSDVAIVGLGPAGRALAHRCALAGMNVVAVDPHPGRTWTPTYGAWCDELPHWLSPAVRSTTVAAPSVRGTCINTLNRPYTVLDTPGLHSALSLDGVRVVTGSALTLDDCRVTLVDGTTLDADFVVDARGTPIGDGAAEQTAFGMVVPASVARPALGDADAWFMDWSLDNGAGRTSLPSFLYAVPLSDDRMLLEETCLIGAPPLSFSELRLRLIHRLRERGVSLSGSEPIERVRFAVTPPAHGDDGVVYFGSRGCQMHPATGYSVASSLCAADAVVTDIVAGRRPGSKSARAAAVSGLRNLGSTVLTTLPNDRLPAFFDAFFALDIDKQRAYLSGSGDVTGVATAMLSMFGGIDTKSRLSILRAAVTAGGSSAVQVSARKLRAGKLGRRARQS